MIVVLAKRRVENPRLEEYRDEWAIDEFGSVEEALAYYADLYQDGWDRIIVARVIPLDTSLKVSGDGRTVSVTVPNRSKIDG